jgi:site-specific DNA-methyltransferase (adenine-specific)
MIEINKIHNKDWILNDLPDKSVQLCICDPPYFEVKGAFDFVWNSFEDYLKDVEKWAIECKRLLADNGTLFWYGHAKKIAYAQIISRLNLTDKRKKELIYLGALLL